MHISYLWLQRTEPILHTLINRCQRDCKTSITSCKGSRYGLNKICNLEKISILYPTWHDATDDSEVAAWFSFNHDLFRSIKKGQPFLLMESTPSLTNWQEVSVKGQLDIQAFGVHVLKRKAPLL
jgi:hypothetical protein